jgi:hypothetical protein
MRIQMTQIVKKPNMYSTNTITKANCKIAVRKIVSLGDITFIHLHFYQYPRALRPRHDAVGLLPAQLAAF